MVPKNHTPAIGDYRVLCDIKYRAGTLINQKGPRKRDPKFTVLTHMDRQVLSREENIKSETQTRDKPKNSPPLHSSGWP
jgi:hypothetical protein